MSYQYKRVNIFAGHYGSGKTNIAVNTALHLKTLGYSIVCADLDIVNPYFRTRDCMELLRQNGIDFIGSAFANTNVDMPALPAEMYAVTDDRSRYAVIDLGGDDMGARAMGRYRDAILRENNFDCFFVVNPYRPLTSTVALALQAKEEIEQASGIPFTGIINNANLGDETTAEDILQTGNYFTELSKYTLLPVVRTCFKTDLLPELEKKTVHPFPVRLYLKQGWNRNE